MKKIALFAPLLTAVGLASPSWQSAPADIDALLRNAVEQKQVPMVVAMVADANGVIYEQAVATPKDAIFGIASMTKPITSVAVMQLVEAGKVKLDEPAATYVPELAAVKVLDRGTLRPPKTPVTVRQLLTHTSGFGYEFMNKEIFDLVAKKELPSAAAGGDGFLKAPLLVDPGTQWVYGISTDWLGRLVEQVSGQSLDVYFRERIFAPLRMTDSYFNVPADKQSRMAPTFLRTPDGGLAQGPPRPLKPTGFFSGGGGLFSTAPDYLRLVRAIMAGGELEQRRILSRESVALLGRNHIGNLTVQPIPSLIPQFITDRAVLPGAADKFGLGFAVNSTTAGTERGVNTLSWAGAMNTFFWIDREKQIGAVLMSQMLPALEPGPRTLFEDFDRLVYAWRSPRKSL